eukprot:COSAG01_NODE_1725_length_9377_cov_5.690235_3_plen_79_part_00
MLGRGVRPSPRREPLARALAREGEAAIALLIRRAQAQALHATDAAFVTEHTEVSEKLRPLFNLLGGGWASLRLSVRVC